MCSCMHKCSCAHMFVSINVGVPTCAGYSVSVGVPTCTVDSVSVGVRAVVLV